LVKISQNNQRILTLKVRDSQKQVLIILHTIWYKLNEQTNEERENYIKKERRYDSYSRSFYVENVKRENITAKYNDGILVVTLPKSEDADNKRRNIQKFFLFYNNFTIYK